MAMIHPARGLTPAANASGRDWLPGRRRQRSWQNPVTFDLTCDSEEVDGAADIRCGLADPATCGLPAVRENSEKALEWVSWVRYKAFYISDLGPSWRSTLREHGREAERPAEGGSRESRQGARCRRTTAWRRPPAHLLRRSLLDRFNHMRLPRVGDARRAPQSILRYYTNEAILWMPIQLTIHLGQPAVAISRRPRLVRAEAKPVPGRWSDPNLTRASWLSRLGRERTPRGVEPAPDELQRPGTQSRGAEAYPPSSFGMKKISQPGRIGWK
jgi:hypothetical protein